MSIDSSRRYAYLHHPVSRRYWAESKRWTGSIGKLGCIGLASPATTSLTVAEFPFHYQNRFRVYNNGDEDAVITIKVTTPYSDVRQWVSLDQDIFVIPAESSTVCTFTIDAEEGYTGDYAITFTLTKLPQELTELPQEGGIMAVAYIGLGVEFTLTVQVPPEAGDSSLGERPPTPEVAPEAEPEPATEEQLEEVAESKAGAIWEQLVKPIVLSIPSSVVQGESVELSASFVGGGEPAAMGLLLVSPSGREYRLSRSTTFEFDEPGKWSVIVTIADHAILGQPVEVLPRQELIAWNVLIMIAMGAVILIGAITVAMVMRWRRWERTGQIPQ